MGVERVDSLGEFLLLGGAGCGRRAGRAVGGRGRRLLGFGSGFLERGGFVGEFLGGLIHGRFGIGGLLGFADRFLRRGHSLLRGAVDELRKVAELLRGLGIAEPLLVPARARHVGGGFGGVALHWCLLGGSLRETRILRRTLGDFCHGLRALREVARGGLGLTRRLDPRERLLPAQGRRLSTLLIVLLLLVSFLRFLGGAVRGGFGLVLGVVQRRDQLPDFLENPVRLRHNLLDLAAVREALRSLHELVGKWHRHRRALGRHPGAFEAGFVGGLVEKLARAFRGDLRLPGQCRREPGRFQHAEFELGVVVLGDALIHLDRRRTFGFRGAFEFRRREIERGVGDLLQLLLRFRIFRQLRDQLIEQSLRVLRRHLGQHRGLGEILVELRLDPQILLRLAQRGARFLRIFPLLQRRVVPADLAQRLHDFLLLLDRAIEVRLLLRHVGTLRDLPQRLLGGGRRLFQHRQRVVRVAHAVALIFFQNVLHVRVGADQVFERLDLAVDLLLPRELRRDGGLGFLSLRGRRLAGGLIGIRLERGLLLGQREREFANARRELEHVFPRGLQRAAQQRQRRPQLAADLLQFDPCDERRVSEFPPLAHLESHRAERRAGRKLPEQRRRLIERLARVRVLHLQPLKPRGSHQQARGKPRPIARHGRPAVRHLHLPAIQRDQCGDAVRHLLQIVTGFQNPHALRQHIEPRVSLFQAVPRRQRQHRERGHRGPAEIAHKGIVRHGAHFLEVGVGFESVRRRVPASVDQTLPLRGRELHPVRQHRLFATQLFHAGPGGLRLLREILVHAAGKSDRRVGPIDRHHPAGGRRLRRKLREQHLGIDGIRHGLAEVPRETLEQSPHLLVRRFIQRLLDLFTHRAEVRAAEQPLGLRGNWPAAGLERLQHAVHVFAHPEDRVETRGDPAPILGRLADRRQLAEPALLTGNEQPEFHHHVDLLGGEIEAVGLVREIGHRLGLRSQRLDLAGQIARDRRGGLGRDEREQLPSGLDLAAVDPAEQPAQQHKIGALVIRRRVAERHVERRPSLRELRLAVRESRRARRHHLLPGRVRGLGPFKLQPHHGRRVIQHRGGNRQRLYGLAQRLAAGQRREPLHLRGRGHDHDLQPPRLRLAALEVRGHELRRDEIVGLHALPGEIPVALHPRVQPRVLFQHHFLPRAIVHFHHLRDPREPHVIRRPRHDFHQLIGRSHEILRRSFKLRRRHEIRHRANLVFRAELALEIRPRRHQMQPVRARRAQRQPRREPPIRQRHQRDRHRCSAPVHAEFAALERLIRRDLQLDLRALQARQPARLFLHGLRRDLGVGGKAVGLFKGDLVRPRHGGELEVARAPIARLHPVAHVFAAHLNGCGKAVAAQRFHLGNVPPVRRADRLDVRGLRRHAFHLNDHRHRVALRHRGIARARRFDEQLRARHVLEIRARHQRAEEERLETVLADQHQPHHRHGDRQRHPDVALDQRHRQQRRHFQTLHPRGNVRLEQAAELIRIKNVALRAPQLHRREQVLAQLRLRVLHEPRDLPLVRRVQKLMQTQPPRDRQHRYVGHRAQRPAHPVGHQREKEIHPRHEDHRAHEHRHRRENPAQNDQRPPPPGKGLEFLQDDGIEKRTHKSSRFLAAIDTAGISNCRRNLGTFSPLPPPRLPPYGKRARRSSSKRGT